MCKNAKSGKKIFSYSSTVGVKRKVSGMKMYMTFSLCFC